MTILRSASGTRIDCDECGEYAASPSLSLDVLMRATGFVRTGGRDLCPACWSEHASRSRAPDDRSGGNGPAAA